MLPGSLRMPATDDPASTDGPRTLFQRVSVLAACDLASRALRFVADIALAQHFGKAIFGQLNLAQALAVQGMGIATFGLDTAGTRDIARAAAPASQIAVTVVLVRLAFGLVTWSAVAGLTLIVPQYREIFALAALYGLSMLTGALTLGWVAQAWGQAQVVGLSVVATHVVYFGGVQAAVALN